jgi:hypothetical protein
MDQQQIGRPAVSEELLHGQVDDVRGLVEQRLHLEIADPRVPQHCRQGAGVAGRSPQLP